MGLLKQLLGTSGLMEVAGQGKVIPNIAWSEFNGRFQIGEGVVRIVRSIGIEVWVELLQPGFRYGELR